MESKAENASQLSESVRRQLLVEWNSTSVTFPEQSGVHHLFESQAQATPDAIAVIFGNATLTYRELNERANQLAHFLRQSGVAANVLVGISTERSLEAVIGVLGILKAGGAYVPLDPAYPQERLAFMLEDAKAPILLTQAKLVERLPKSSAKIVCLDRDWKQIAEHSNENPNNTSGPDNLIYVIYTSGSTGRPKGAGVYHRGFTNLIHWFVTEFAISSEDNNLLVSSLSFDLTQKNLYATLIRGGRLTFLPTGPYDPGLISNLIHQGKVTLLNCTPSAFYPLIEPASAQAFKNVSSLRCVFLGGEPISIPRVKSWFESESCHAEIANTYGPTECTDICAFYRLNRKNLNQFDFVPVGKPVYNVQLAILNENLSLCDIGVAGELCIGGTGVGAGYLNDAALTASKFIANSIPEIPGSKIYKTGDLARYLPDGNIEFLGRMDHQVKIRGFRIELHEIENAFSKHLAVREAVVVVHRPNVAGSAGEPTLVGYYVLKDGAAVAANELRQELKQKLPDYMVPAMLVCLDKFPLSPNGKVDRRALPAPEFNQVGTQPAAATPRTETEQAIARIWQETLGRSQVGFDDNFFDLGGNSIQLAQVQVKLQGHFKIDLPITKLFEFTTISALAGHLSAQAGTRNTNQEFTDRARKQQQLLARQRQLAKGK